MTQKQENPTPSRILGKGFAGYPHLLMTLWVLVGVSAVLGSLLRQPLAGITVLWGLIGIWRLRTPSRWVRLWVLLGALGHVVAGVAVLALRILFQHRGATGEGLEPLLLPIYAMVLIVLGAYVFCQMVLRSVQKELDRRLALARGRTTEEEEKQLSPAEKRELERKRAADSLAETIESIIVAFILAFLFRAFVVEAFVIPTGSMAPTLMGEHYLHVSPTGYDFEVGVSKSGPKAMVCPLSRHDLQRDDRAGRSRPVVPREAGDRILVEKFSVLFGHLPRWTVIVFRNPLFPHDAEFDVRKEFGENFIKRLVGLPGETIMLLDGDLYAVAPGDVPAGEKLTIEQLAERVMTKGKICSKLLESPKAQDELWMPIYSSDYLMEAWGTNGSGDDHPWIRTAPEAYTAGWQSRSRWDCTQKTFHYRGKGDPKLRHIRYVHLQERKQNLTAKNPAARRREMLSAEQFIDDFYAYNGKTGRNMVSDLMVTTEAKFNDAGEDGRIELTLTKYDTAFTAVVYADGRWEIRQRPWPGTAWELRASDSTFVQTDTPPEDGTLIGSNKPNDAKPLKGETQIEFANADHCLSLRIGERQVFLRPSQPDQKLMRAFMRKLLKWTNRGDGRDAWFDDQRNGRSVYGTSTQIDVKKMWPRVILGAADADVQLAKVNLYRDVYYTNAWQPDRTTAEFPYATTDRPLRLKANDFFVLGDNSPESSDGRLWSVEWNPDHKRPDGGDGAWKYLANQPPDAMGQLPADDAGIYLTHLPPPGEYTPGTVPRSYLIGRAFFVYWPSGGRVFSSQLPIMPQVQRMRMIR